MCLKCLARNYQNGAGHVAVHGGGGYCMCRVAPEATGLERWVG